MTAQASTPLALREARREDVPLIVAMLADDMLGSAREDTGAGQAHIYTAAFDEIARDPNNRLLVAECGGDIVGTLQMTFIRGLSHRGAKRALIEAVRVAAAHRGKGLGQQMIEAAIGIARANGCAMVQLTTNKARKDAQRFYARLGFAASHEGMKLDLR